MPNCELTGQQELALIALVGGANISQAAERAGVARETVSGWINHNDVFVADLEARRLELWRHNLSRLRLLLAEAVEALSELMRSDNEAIRLQAARTVVQAVAPGRLEVAALGQSTLEVRFVWEGENGNDGSTPEAT